MSILAYSITQKDIKGVEIWNLKKVSIRVVVDNINFVKLEKCKEKIRKGGKNGQVLGQTWKKKNLNIQRIKLNEV